MDLSWDHFNSSLQAKTHILPLKQQFWLCWLSWKIWHTQTNQNWNQSQLFPYKTRYVFSRSPPGQGFMSTNLLPVIARRMEPTNSCFKVLPSHMKLLRDHYKGPHTISKGHTPLIILVAAMEKCKPTLLLTSQWISIAPSWSPDIITIGIGLICNSR